VAATRRDLDLSRLIQQLIGSKEKCGAGLDERNSGDVRPRALGRSALQPVVRCALQVLLELIDRSMEYYGPRFKLEVLPNNTDDHNPPEYLEAIK